MFCERFMGEETETILFYTFINVVVPMGWESPALIPFLGRTPLLTLLVGFSHFNITLEVFSSYLF